METNRLRLLVELSRLGSMRAVADELSITTSSVSQQLTALHREVGVPLIEPVGRQVRLTPTGRRLAGHAVTILAAVEAALSSVDPTSEPEGTVRVAGFAGAVRRSLLPAIGALAGSAPGVELVIAEHERPEAMDLLKRDDVDLALTYDYDLAPQAHDDELTPYDREHLWSIPWGLGVPVDHPHPAGPADLASFAAVNWIANSRDNADERVIRTLASRAGFEPRIRHRADSLSLLGDLIAAGHGIGLLPMDLDARTDIRIIALPTPALQRAYAVTVPGRAEWPALRVVLEVLRRGPSL